MTGDPRLSCLVAVVDSADAIIDGVHDGWACLISAAIPATWGAAMLVPEMSAKWLPASMGSSKLVGLQAAKIWSPGARISGFRMSAGFCLLSMMSGPLDENRATVGNSVSLKEATLPSLMAALPPYLRAAPLPSLEVENPQRSTNLGISYSRDHNARDCEGKGLGNEVSIQWISN